VSSANSTVSISKFNKNVTLNVTVRTTKQFRLRVWLGTRLIMLAGWIMGCNIFVEQSRTELSPDDFFGAGGPR
jgi:hypothetical protein